ncbi:glycosyltransferase [Levilactobacillus yonginensis]
MNYFVNVNLGDFLTGIESAEFNRMKLFLRAGLSAKLLYLWYNPRLHELLNKFGEAGNGYSMYDYFQGCSDYSGAKKIDWVTDWKQRHYELEYIQGATDIRVFKDRRMIMYAHFIDKSYKEVDYINYFNQNHVKLRRDVYDSRGFLSRTSYLNDDELVNTELYFDSKKKIRIIKKFLPQDGKAVLCQITLKEHNHREYFFKSEHDFRVFFINELNEKEDIFYCDRNSRMAADFYDVNANVKVAAVFHSTHVQPGQDVVTGELKNGVYDFTLNHPDKLTRIIVSTQKQRQDLIHRFSDLPPVVVIPVGYANHQEVDITRRNPYHIISVARYSPEKQLMHQVKAVEALIPEFPEIELHLFGFGSEIEDQIKEYISSHNLDGHIFLRGFYSNLDDEYRKASLALMTSIEEGFSLSTLEELSFDIPVIGYNINYGPSELIKDGQNGFLVPANDQPALQQKIREYLLDPSVDQQMMLNCGKSIEEYTPDSVMKKWESFVENLQQNPRKKS